MDGEVITGAAIVHPCPSGGGWCVEGAGTGGVESTSDWTWPAGAHGWAWVCAVLATVVLALIAVVIVSVVRKTAANPGSAAAT